MGILKGKNLDKERTLLLLVCGIFCLFLPFLIKESLEKTVFLGIITLLWLVIFFYTKNLILSSLLYILIVLPFNLTFQLPLVVEIFNTNITLAQPFTEGIYVNYLVPTISIIDIGLFLILSSLLVKKGFSFYLNTFKNYKNGLSILLFFFLVQNLFLRDLNISLFSLRIYSVIFLLVVLVKDFRRYLKGAILRKKLLMSAGYIFLLNTLFQGILGIIQFARGSSLGLYFLGESKVVSGMMGSSFIELSNQLFLRAYGTFPHPNILAAYFLLAIFIGILIFRQKESLGLLLISLSFIFLLFTFSRIGVFLALVSIVGFVIREVFTKRVKPWQNFSFSPLLLVERFTNLFAGGDVSWTERKDLLESGLRVFRDNWIIGVGGSNFVKGMEGFVPRTSRGILLLQPVHNICILFLSELGIVGFTFFFYVLLKLLFENVGKITILKGLIIFSLIVMGMFDHFLFSLPQGIILFAVLLIILCLPLEDLNNYKKEVDKD